MRTLFGKLQAIFAAVAFAEADERELALEVAGISPEPISERASVLQTLNTTFAAAAFAEADCPETALAILRSGEKKKSFLATVGLERARVRYGLVPVRHSGFLESVGLGGVRSCLGIVSMESLTA